MNKDTSPASPLKPRYAWLDAVKALAITLVIFGHLPANGSYLYAVYEGIKLPLFFAASGFVFNVNKIDSAKKFFSNLAVRLAIPYVFISFSYRFFNEIPNIIDGTYTLTHAAETIKLVFTGQILWFVPVLFFCELIMFFVLKIFKKNEAVLFVIFMIGILFGYFICSAKQYPWNPQIVAIAFPMFLSGYFLRKYIFRVSHRIKFAIACFCGAVYIFLPLILRLATGKWYYLSMLNGIYIFYPVNMLLTYCGIVFVFIVASKLRFPKFVTALGRNTLFYYGYHMTMANYCILILQHVVSPQITMNYLRSSVKLRLAFCLLTVIVMLILAPFSWLVNRTLPFIVGKRYREITPLWKYKKSINDSEEPAK